MILSRLPYYGSIFNPGANSYVDARYTAPAAETATFWTRQCSYVYSGTIFRTSIQCSGWSIPLTISIP